MIKTFPCRECGALVPTEKARRGPEFCFCHRKCFERFRAKHGTEFTRAASAYRATVLRGLTRAERQFMGSGLKSGDDASPLNRIFDYASILSLDAPTECGEFLTALQEQELSASGVDGR